MKLAVFLYVVLLIAGAVLIHMRQDCERLVANRDLATNHLLQAGDWRDDAPDGLACSRSDSARIDGRYLKEPVAEGAVLAYSKTIVRPAHVVPGNHSLFWLSVKNSENLHFAEPGSRFDACDESACPFTALRAEAIRCTSVAPRLCEVAVIVPDAEAARIAQIATKSFRMVFRQDAARKATTP